ncbi:hypothetical protein [Alteromonas sp. C1M14]|uniref:hypothetical protein n=1 Tax=Alteromonas sp. C1M14 TaxID=2841567 RepID=UPI001C0A1856|nr:hypothetical protein [Alteromonas sp. C1M14]MBU2977600.1 hypothetical protein [Alteromonas sp. C1M14]
MWRSIVVLFEIAALITVLRLPFVQYLFEDVHEEVAQWYESIATWQEKRELSVLERLTASQREKLRPFQQEYIDDILSSRAKIASFHQTFCITDNINPFIHGAELAQFCSAIDSTHLLAANH